MTRNPWILDAWEYSFLSKGITMAYAVQKWSPIGLDTIFLAGDRPVITKDASGRLDVFWENANNYQLRTQASPNSSWEARFGSEQSAEDWDGDPVIARNANGTPEVFWVHEWALL